VKLLVEWVSMTELGSTIDLLPGVRAPGTTEDLIPESVDVVAVTEDDGPFTITSTSNGTTTQFQAGPTVTVENSTDVVEVSMSAKLDHVSVTNIADGYTFTNCAVRDGGSSVTILSNGLIHNIGDSGVISATGSVTGLTPGDFDCGISMSTVQIASPGNLEISLEDMTIHAVVIKR
jgi:hypothetical protein